MGPNTQSSKPDTARKPFLLFGAMALTAVILVGGASISGMKADVDPRLTVQSSSEFRFADASDGSVLILDGKGDLVKSVDPGTNGFLRATLRGLARQRHARGIGAERPFQIVRYTTGHVSLLDPATGARVALDAFGKDNAIVFARLLKEQKS